MINTFGGSPATLTLGTGELSPAVEACLIGMEEGTHTKLIACRQQPATLAIPQDEGEVAGQMLHAAITPRSIGLQTEFAVCWRRCRECLRKPCRQIAARIEAYAANDPIPALQVGAATPLAVEAFARMDEGKLRRTGGALDDEPGTRQRPAIDGLT